MKGLVDESGEGTKLLEMELCQVLEKWSLLSTPCVKNMIRDVRVHCGEGEYIDNILKLKKASTYDYIHDSRFLGQRKYEGHCLPLQNVNYWPWEQCRFGSKDTRGRGSSTLVHNV